jgi:hypothetical protein
MDWRFSAFVSIASIQRSTMRSGSGSRAISLKLMPARDNNCGVHSHVNMCATNNGGKIVFGQDSPETLLDAVYAQDAPAAHYHVIAHLTRLHSDRRPDLVFDDVVFLRSLVRRPGLGVFSAVVAKGTYEVFPSGITVAPPTVASQNRARYAVPCAGEFA